jgi:hypothetical protein
LGIADRVWTIGDLLDASQTAFDFSDDDDGKGL